MNNAYPINIIPENDAQRVAALERYQIFNVPTEPAFNNIVTLASTIFKVPIAHLSFLDAAHEFVMANIGIGEIGLIDRGESLCALTVIKPEVLVVEDALKEPLLEKHPAVHGEFALRFYAGAPIITPEGHIIGTMCLVDKKPRTLSDHEKEILVELAKVAMEQVELRRVNIEKTENLNFLLSQKDEFIGIASHELKTPITSIKGYLQLMGRLQTETAFIHLPGLIQKASTSLNKLSSLVNDMLTANRLTTGMLSPEKQEFDIQQAIATCCKELSEVDLASISIIGEEHLLVYADPDHISQAMRSLIENAKKYATGLDRIQIEVTKKQDNAIVSITDKGPGIGKDKLRKLFERYTVYDASMQLSGLGLGLYISADIIKSNGGTIGVESELGKGTTFWFTLPLAPKAK